jgi:SAM-dependent methyltransferase
LIQFTNYPFEWPAEMFEQAARLTLELAAGAIAAGFSLKDATPWNVMFRGPEPVFLDMASFERRDPLERVWMPYGQFVRTFLTPLILWRATGARPGDLFRVSRDGLKPQECFQRMGLWRSLRSPALETCAMPALLSWWARRQKRTTAEVRPTPARSAEEASFVVSRLVRRLERALNRVTANMSVRSDWTGYEGEVAAREFAPGYLEAKDKFVSEALTVAQPIACLDVGCNTGYFSLLAARVGASVTAIDSDAASVGELYRRARIEGLNVLPLVVDVARPTPALGWNYRESVSFLDRTERARFDTVMMLALLHHLCLIERLPLIEVAGLAARFTSSWLIVEFVPREDPMAQRMPGVWMGSSDWSHYDQPNFEAAVGNYFSIARKSEVAGSGRTIYLMRREGGTA